MCCHQMKSEYTQRKENTSDQYIHAQYDGLTHFHHELKFKVLIMFNDSPLLFWKTKTYLLSHKLSCELESLSLHL